MHQSLTEISLDIQGPEQSKHIELWMNHKTKI